MGIMAATLKDRISETSACLLGTSHNMAYADGRLVTLITPRDDRAEALYRTEPFGNRDG